MNKYLYNPKSFYHKDKWVLQKHKIILAFTCLFFTGLQILLQMQSTFSFLEILLQLQTFERNIASYFKPYILKYVSNMFLFFFF